MARKAYLAKKGEQSYMPLSTRFDGLRILSVKGMDEQGKPVNVYTAQWVNTQEEDYAIGSASNTIITENVNLEVSFIVSDKYATNRIDVRQVHDAFVQYITKGDLWLKSQYEEKEVHCTCLEEYKPTLARLKRARGNNFIMGTIKLHALDLPWDTSEEPTNELYLGFGGASISSMSDIESLTNLQHYERDDIAGDYGVSATTTSYLWLCATSQILRVVSSMFEVPMDDAVQVGDLLCYRSSNSIAAGLMEFTIIV